MESLSISALACALAPIAFCAVTDTSLAGHWEGKYKLPDKEFAVAVDLAKSPSGQWEGSLALPSERMEDIQLSDIKVDGASVLCVSKEKVYAVQGELSGDGNSIKGGFIASFLKQVPVPMELRRTANAQVKAAAQSTPVPKALLGAWTGAVRYAGATSEIDLPKDMVFVVRIELKAGPGGLAEGEMTSPFDPAKKAPLTVIATEAGGVRLESRGTGSVFIGRVHGDEIAGEWKQFGADAASLVLKRP